MTSLPKAAAAAQARTAALVRALRDAKPPIPDYDIERIALAAAGGPRPLGGWHTTHEPEQRRFSVRGTICDVEVTPPFIGGYDYLPSLSDAGDAAIRRVCSITGEGFTDVMINGRRRWTGPMG